MTRLNALTLLTVGVGSAALLVGLLRDGVVLTIAGAVLLKIGAVLIVLAWRTETARRRAEGP